jgi:lipopolysaccharide/colanic/teichoic acid biosynthesis glycosyltransferase
VDPLNQRRLSVSILIADLVWSVVAIGVSVVLRYGVHWSGLDKDSAVHLLPFLAAVWIIWVLFSLFLPLDGFRDGWRLSAVVSQLFLAATALTLMLLSGGYLARRYVSRLALINFCLLLPFGFVLIRIAAYSLLRARSKNGSAKRVVVAGRGRLARELVRKIQRHPEMLCCVVGFLAPDDGTADLSSVVNSFPVRRTGALGVVEMLSELRTDELILVLEECTSPDLLSLAALCRDRGIRVSLVPQFYELYLSRPHLTDLGGLPVLELARPGFSVPAVVAKRIFDLALGIVFSLASIPILLPLAGILRWRKREAFRWETRCGLHGEPFAMLRLNIDRTADNGSRFEAALRKFSLTELPQLWNVLRGDMSLVGPRPEPRDRVCRYSEWQQQRLAIKPGMTGLAQVQGLREQHSSEEKTRFDLQYLLNCSLWNDLSLLLQTAWTLARRSADFRNVTADRGSIEANEEAVGVDSQQEILENAHRS